MLRTLPVAGTFCISCPGCDWAWVKRMMEGELSERGYQVLITFQLGRCFDVSFGSVADGQCYSN